MSLNRSENSMYPMTQSSAPFASSLTTFIYPISATSYQIPHHCSLKLLFPSLRLSGKS